MRISTKGRYALRLMIDLAMNRNGEMVRIREIAERQHISEKYLEQIISVLKKAGYVRSFRGAQGGYQLTKEPREYTVGMIFRLTEGNMAPVACLEDENNLCEKANQCVSLRLWNMLNESINHVIDNVTLQDMVEWEMENVNNYVI